MPPPRKKQKNVQFEDQPWPFSPRVAPLEVVVHDLPAPPEPDSPSTCLALLPLALVLGFWTLVWLLSAENIQR